jgi:hypothetical protein
MRKKSGVVAGVIVTSAFCLSAVHTAAASVFSSINYNQVIEVSPNPLSGPPVTKTLSGIMLPLNQTLSVDLNGETSQATYDFTDNGSVASLSINSSFNLAAADENAGEATNDTQFEFTQNVSYFASLEDTANGTFGGVPPYVEIYLATGQSIFSLGGPSRAGYFQTSGTLLPDTVYVMDEEFLSNNSSTGDSPTGNGTDQVTLTFTAIPEPSSFCLLTIVSAGLLARRRRLSPNYN